MKMHKYAISMEVPLGKRIGELLLYELDGKLNGKLSILGHTEPFIGMIEEDGSCELTGKITSAIRTIPYRAVGYIKERSIILTVYGEMDELFYIMGEENS